jgi:hypothetical protein
MYWFLEYMFLLNREEIHFVNKLTASRISRLRLEYVNFMYKPGEAGSIAAQTDWS